MDRTVIITGAGGGLMARSGLDRLIAPIGAWATNDSGSWTLLDWQPPDLYRIDGSGGTKPLWFHYRLSRRLSPINLAHDRSYDLASRINHGPRINPIPEAVDAMVSIGVAEREPPHRKER